MVEVDYPLTFLKVVKKLWLFSIIEIGFCCYFESIFDSLLTCNRCQHVAVVAWGEVGKKFKAKAGSPDRKRIASLIGLNCVFDNVVSILSPPVANVDVGASSCKEHTIDLWKNVVEIWSIGEGKDGNYLCSRHLYKLDIGGSDIWIVPCCIGMGVGLV